MTYFMRKIYVAVTLLSITSLGYANEDYDNSLTCGETENDFCCEPISCGLGFISADLLYWRAFESGLDACVPGQVSDIVTSDGKVVSRFKGRGRDPHFDWNPGFRIAAGYELPCSDLDIAASWTYFHSRSHGPRNHGNKIRWNLNFDAVDVVAGYESDFGACFALRPFGGLRGAWIDQKLRIHGTSNSASSSVTNDLLEAKTKNKENFWGVGPLIGLGADWNIGCGFSLYTSASIAWLYGNIDVRLREADETVDTVNLCRVKKRLDANLAVADAALGIRWQTCFCRNTRLILQLGLEHHRYFDYNRIGGYGDLCFDGFNFSAGLEF
ncbi:Lpg1974 family pore-forming outer membrane protein [Parachlamydia acanthamoebae]|uniref:Lpg1974 family pore-forming outer membrane protein n=1 Tax=Parachlamydia acanthamoebae TaxID=83552 RepID=UPI00075153F8|nr:Lpg1974 family pore-forming outer membrane protein [Parachlamydia acanthamoebae]